MPSVVKKQEGSQKVSVHLSLYLCLDGSQTQAYHDRKKSITV